MIMRQTLWKLICAPEIGCVLRRGKLARKHAQGAGATWLVGGGSGLGMSWEGEEGRGGAERGRREGAIWDLVKSEHVLETVYGGRI